MLRLILGQNCLQLLVCRQQRVVKEVHHLVQLLRPPQQQLVRQQQAVSTTPML